MERRRSEPTAISATANTVRPERAFRWGLSPAPAPPALTRAACPPGSLDFDYLRALDSATAFESTREELSITYPQGLLRFTRSEDGSGKIGP
jgi:hypothetical protein